MFNLVRVNGVCFFRKLKSKTQNIKIYEKAVVVILVYFNAIRTIEFSDKTFTFIRVPLFWSRHRWYANPYDHIYNFCHVQLEHKTQESFEWLHSRERL